MSDRSYHVNQHRTKTTELKEMINEEFLGVLLYLNIEQYGIC
jgi:hypothetical protein